MPGLGIPNVKKIIVARGSHRPLQLACRTVQGRANVGFLSGSSDRGIFSEFPGSSASKLFKIRVTMVLCLPFRPRGTLARAVVSKLRGFFSGFVRTIHSFLFCLVTRKRFAKRE